jgi:lysophospholipase L1-like esterase
MNISTKCFLSLAALITVCGAGIPALAQPVFNPGMAAVRKPGTTVRIDLIGDSTQTDNAGYGRGFCANFTAKVDCVNTARGGASTHTYRELGLWDRALATKPDYMVIQFGHNDMVDTAEPMARQTPLPDYVVNLKRFVTEARAAGITPVLCTPLVRRFWHDDGKIHSNLIEYSAAMRSVAQEMHVPLIELHDESIAYLEKAGRKESDSVSITKKDPDGKTIFDETHLDWKGSYIFGRMVAVDLGNAVPALKKYVLPKAATLPPAGLRAMQVINGAPVKIVLVGDSTVATGGGWGPGFCATMTPNVTCVDLALNGRSSKSFIDEGAWTKALAEKGDYYLVQFGHNDQKSDAARHTDAEGSFKEYLQRYVSDVDAQGAVPVLVTSLSRRTFKDGRVVEDLKDYAQASREVGIKDSITVIDLNSISTSMLNRMGQEEADKFNAVGRENEREAAGKSAIDRTHLNPDGQKMFGRIVAEQLARTLVELGPDLIGQPMKTAQ